MKAKKTIILCLTVAAAATVCLLLLRGKSSGAGAFQLVMARAERSTISNSVTATGTVEPVVKVEVGTQVSGIIDKIYVDFNSVVTRGQLIAEMDKVNLQAELISKEADLASSKTEFEYQEKNYARSRMLHGKQLISDTDFETATYNYERAKSSYDRIVSEMTKVRRNLQYAIITSPIDGVVINRAVEEGQTVAAGFSTPTLFTIANDLTQMRVIADVDEADIGQVEEGQNVKFTVDAYPNDVFGGKVTQVRLEAIVTSNVVTYEVVISAYNPDLKLKPGLTASVTIYTLERPDILTIPSKALRFVPDAQVLESMKLSVAPEEQPVPAGRKIVWQKSGDTLLPRVIATGASSLNVTEVTEGLADGEEIVLEMVSASSAAPAAPGNPFMMGGPPRGGGRGAGGPR
jgi:HlyD family secretion protein